MSRPIVISAIPSAFHPDGSLDLEGTGRIIRHALDGGVDSVFVNGTTGEFPALNRDERSRIVAAAVDIAGTDRVIAHIGGSSAWEAVAFTKDAVGHGATSLAAITPFYLPASESAVHEYFAAIREAAPAAKLYAYLFPDRTAVHLSADEAARLVFDFELSGVKVSIPGIDFVSELVEVLPEGPQVFSGNDGLLASVHGAGGAGVVSGVSSAMPWSFVAMADAVDRRDAKAQSEIQTSIDIAVATLGPSIAGLKKAIQLQGVIDSAGCRMAIDPPDDALDERIRVLIGGLATPQSAGPLAV
ncbi:MAG: dapA [Microbacteriaceae bacterium]|jgi:4-hydroxy-tetrahydrodipicolinate synthase|nr:dapA [Microbacteriaceae bacterium]